MKLILTTDVTGLGGPGDLVEVKDGYGRNYLLPRGMAIPATKGAAKQVQTIRRAQDARRVTGNCSQHQRDVAIAVKNAREMALLPYTSTAR